MVIHRSRILKSTLAAVNRPSFSYERRIVVEFAGEDGQDNGGPRREYLRYWNAYVCSQYSLLYWACKYTVFENQTPVVCLSLL